MFMCSLLSCFAVLFLQLWGVNTLPLIPVCPASCLCQKTPLLNCSSSGLSRAPSLIPTTATALDLSHNALHSLVPLGSGHAHKRGLQQLWVGNNALERLSLCWRTEGTRTLARRKERCVPWAPDLQLLSAERNQLKCLPRGLGSVKSLRVLQLSWNRISELGPVAIAGCTQLQELYLQHNLINTIHPQAFKDLQRLQVLDLSYNLLTIIPVPAYLSLQNLNTLVAVTGNKWRCDCNLKILRRWISLDSELGNSTWKVVCFSPLHHAGKDLRYLHESEFTCPSHVYNTPGLYKEETVNEGMELLLSCDTVNQDFKQYHWWTPHGHVSESKQILLSNITEQHAGLYVCVSGFLKENVSVLNLNVRKRDHDRRLRREVNMETQSNIQKATAQVPQSEFVLAVCLSVFITFIVAFVLGVVLRPFLDKLCKRIRTKDSESPPNSRSSSTVPMPYVNEGYSDDDDRTQKVRTGSRVTFGGVTEVKNGSAGNVLYDVTVEDTRSDSSSDSRIDVDISYDNTHKKEPLVKHLGAHCVEVDNLRAKADCNPNSLQELSKQLPLREKNKKTSLIADTTKIKEFEVIPEPEDSIDLEENCVSSMSSCDMKESVEQSVDPPTVTVLYDGKSITDMEGTMPGCSESPFEQKQESVDDMDPDLWNDSGESFSFSDGSPRSSSRISQLVLDCPLNKNEMSVDNQSDRQSSCNTSESGESEGGQTEYTINPEEEEEESENDSIPQSENYNIQPGENGNSSHPEANLPGQPHTGAGTHFRQDTVTLDPTDMHIAFTQGDSFDDGPFMDHNECSDSSNINDNEEELIEYHVHPVYRTSQTTTSILIDESNADSSSEDEDEYSDYPRRLEITELEGSSDHSVPVTIPDKVLNINFDNSSSSTDIEKTSKEGERKNFKGLSVLSVLFNRSRAETDKADQTLSKTTNTDSGGFLGLGFNKQTVSSEDTVKPTIGERSFFGKIGQAFDRLPKLNRSLVFSVSDPSLAAQCVSTPDSEFKSQGSPLSLSSQEIFFGNTNVTLGPIPKVKRSLQFTQSEPEISVQDQSNLLNTERISQELMTKPSTKGDSFFGKIGSCPEEVPKVKRYIQFTQSEPEISVQDPSNLLNTERITSELLTKPESWKSDSSSAEELCPATKEDSFFEKTGPDVEVPKVKRYIQFSKSEPEISVQDQSNSLNTERFTPELVTKPTTKGDHFFGKIGPCPEVPKVKRYIQFTQSEPEILVQHSPTSLDTERITSELLTKPQSWRSDSSSEAELSPITKEDSFFGKTDLCLEEVPKVKKYIQFTQSEPEISVQDPSNLLNTERITSELLTKPQSWKSDSSSAEELSPDTKEDSFFEKTGPDVEVPKVKRYIQFSKSEPEISVQDQSNSLNTERFTPELVTKPSTKGDHFFGKIGPCPEVPKVKRYIQFTQSEPEISVQDPSNLLNTERITSELLTKPQSWKSDSSSAEELCPATKDSFFEKAGPDVEVPKVKRYIQFTKSEPEILVQDPSNLLNTERITPELETKPTTKGDSFFGKIGPHVEVPKVKRYIQFTKSEPEILVQHSPTSLDTERITSELLTKPQSWRSDSSSEAELSPITKGDSFFGKTDLCLEEVPKVKRYMQFTKSEPEISVQDPSNSLNTERITPELVMKPQSLRSDSSSEAELSPSTKEGSLFGKIGPFLEDVPKVKRYIQFTKSEPELHSLSQSQSESSVQQALTSDIMKRECKTLGFSCDNIAESSSSFFEGVCMSLDSIPKVKRSLYFSERQSPNQSMFPSLNTKKVTSDTLMKSDSTGSSTSGGKDPSPNQGNFIGQIGLFLDQVPKVERYLQFSQTELNPTSQPSSINIQEVTKTEFQPRSSRSFEDIKQASSGDVFESIGSVDTSVIEIPKLKRYLKFTDSQRVTPELASKPQYTNFERRHSFSSENVLPLTTNTDNFFEKTDTFLKGESKVNRYIHFIRSVPYTPTMSPSPSINMLATMTEGIDSRKSGENFKPTDTLSLKEDPSLGVVTETSMLGQLSRPKRSLFFSNSDTYVQLDQPFTPTQPGLMQTSLYFSSDDKESSNAQDSNRKAWLSTTVSETTMESRWSNLGLSSTQPHVTESHGLSQIPKRSLQLSTSQEISDSISNSGQDSTPRQHLVADNPIQNVSEETPETPQVSLGKDDAKEYLRHSSEARQRQEWRRLMFQQKRRAMDGFSLTSPSSPSDDNEQGSLSVHYERTVPSYSEHTHPGVSTGTKSLTASNKDVEISGFEGQRAKSISSLRCKSIQHYGIDKYHSDV